MAAPATDYSFLLPLFTRCLWVKELLRKRRRRRRRRRRKFSTLTRGGREQKEKAPVRTRGGKKEEVKDVPLFDVIVLFLGCLAKVSLPHPPLLIMMLTMICGQDARQGRWKNFFKVQSCVCEEGAVKTCLVVVAIRRKPISSTRVITERSKCRAPDSN